uniref:Uncharacterized protein n=1 Tax=Pyrodinium bahamense TaxID=73915 RepID=A0A7S0FL58_9DINO|mmetsp:Transcript_36518/g.101361  ORF Transcript_36518/g.101361 Transcript_36518/m.101361 type:complete len:104 (+) Transcript_36518:76-387(+)
MAEGGDSANAGSSTDPPANDQPQERSCARDCGEGTLECFAFLGRGVVTTGRGCYTVTKTAAYPVKQGIVRSKDACSSYFHPYQLKKPVGNSVPSFTFPQASGS